jgi:LuxR family transcriptional regulator, quorum-sensing system regulator BjaR1
VNADLRSTIETIQRQSEAQSILDIIIFAVRAYGIETVIVSGLPDPDLGLRGFALHSGWSKDVALAPTVIDPATRHGFTATLPFEWSGAADTDRGFCVPVFLEGRMQGVVSFVGDHSQLDEKSRLELHMLALYALGRLRYLFSAQSRVRLSRTITSREAEVLQWVAAGKTAAEIAQITGLTTRTVNQHCENAQRRMGTSNRLQTVVEALRHKLISLYAL